MRKNVRVVPLLLLPSFLTLIFLWVPGSTDAQLNCIDFAKYQYPKTVNGKSYEWNADQWNFPNVQQGIKTGIDIGSLGYFHGLLEHLPPSYNTNPTAKYPVIIYFHGNASNGNSSAYGQNELCKLFKDLGSDLATHLSIPGRIEREPAVFNSREFIVISPQNDEYTRNLNPSDRFPSFVEIDSVIRYVERTYRIDPRRIYLTGLSTGANMIMEYVASSLERAKKIAAIMPVSLCSQLYHSNNTSRGINAAYIGQAKLKTWFVYCPTDNCSGSSALNVPQEWVDAIKAVPGHAPPRYTKLRAVTNPALHYQYDCSDTLLHDTWSRAYSPDFVASYVNGNGVNDGINKNAYDWFLESQSAVLPVKLKNFLAKLENRRVRLKWITTDEQDNATFSIERAGRDQHFVTIVTMPGLKLHTGEKEYFFTDESPLTDVSFYRLVQTDIDGEKNYFDIKTIVNVNDRNSSLVTFPNPFSTEVSAFITINKAQKVLISLTDMNGRVLKSVNGIYSPGSTEIKLKSSDLPSGVYLLKVKGEDFTALKKIIRK